jgi:hypothetical protein
MRNVALQKARPLDLSEHQIVRLKQFLETEIEDAMSSRRPLESLWRELLRQYEGVPKNPMRNVPIENAPNIEVTLGAIAADSIYAQVYDLLEQASPFITCRPVPKSAFDDDNGYYTQAVKDLQTFTNHVARSEAKVRLNSIDSVLDCIQLGTGALYVPWVVRRKKTNIARILSSGPVVHSMPIEDYLVPGGSNPTQLDWEAFRFWYTKQDIESMAAVNGWNTLGLSPAGAKDWVRSSREMLGRNPEGVERKGNLYEIFDVYPLFDVDEDGEDEELYCVYDRTSRTVLKASYSPYDYVPSSRFVYQHRAHMVHGIGVLQMVQPYEDEITDVHNFAVMNILLANARMWVAKHDVLKSSSPIYPNKVVNTMDPKNDIAALAMADVYPSIINLQSMIVQLAERRVGVNEMSLPRASAVMGNRTPGITALTMMQQVNKRFAPAFGNIREGESAAVRQCLYRYQEKVRAGDTKVIAHISRTIGVEKSQRVVTLLQNEYFDENVIVELTANSASVNKEADRQNSMMLVSILAQYYQRVIELVMLASNPQTPEPVRDIAVKVAKSAGEVIDRTIRTFDQMRDPETFIIDVEAVVGEALRGEPASAVNQLTQIMNNPQMLQALLPQGGSNGGGANRAAPVGAGSNAQQ